MTEEFKQGFISGLAALGITFNTSNNNSSEGTTDYNELKNIPISLDENGKVIINEQYKTSFDSLANENIEIPTVITNYDQLENTPTIKTPESGTVEGYTIEISPKYKDFFKNLIKKALIELPIASNEILGGVKIGKGLAISEDGILSVEYAPSAPSNDGVKVASIAEILEDKNILINNTISSDYAYLPADGQATKNTLIGGLYTNG